MLLHSHIQGSPQKFMRCGHFKNGEGGGWQEVKEFQIFITNTEQLARASSDCHVVKSESC